MRQRAARQTSASAAWYHGHPARVTEPQHLRDLDLCLGEDDNHRQLTMQHEPVAFVRSRILGAPQDAMLWEELAQCRNHFPLPVHAAQDSTMP
jgi:hypothetical protein